MKKLGHKSLLIFLLTGFAGLFGYLTRMIYAKNLSVEQYGLFYAVFALIFFFGSFRDMGMSEATLYYINKKENKENQKTILFLELLPQIIFSSIFIIVFLFLKNYLVTSYFKDPLANSILNYLIPLFLIETILLTLLSFFRAKQRFIFFNIVQFLSAFLRFFLAFIGFRILKDTSNIPAQTYFFSQICLIIIMLLYFIAKYKNIVKQKIQPTKQLSNQMFSYAIPVMFSTAGAVILTYSDTILLTFFKGTQSVAQYNVAQPSLNIILIFASAFISMIFPIISKLYHNNAKQKIHDLINLLYNNFLIATLPLGLIFFTYPSLIIGLLFGDKYLPAAMALQVFALSFIFIILKDINFGIIAGIGKVKERSKILYYGAGFNIILDIILIPIFDIVGAAIATGLGFILMAFLTTKLVLKTYKINIQKIKILKIIASNIIFLITLNLMKRIIDTNWILETVIVLLISGLIYLMMLFALEIITIKQLKEIKSKYF